MSEDPCAELPLLYTVARDRAGSMGVEGAVVVDVHARAMQGRRGRGATLWRLKNSPGGGKQNMLSGRRKPLRPREVGTTNARTRCYAANYRAAMVRLCGAGKSFENRVRDHGEHPHGTGAEQPHQTEHENPRSTYQEEEGRGISPMQTHLSRNRGQDGDTSQKDD